MVAKSIKSARCDDVLNVFMASSKGCVFLTLTTPDVVDIYEIRRRWAGVRHFLCEKFKGVKYVMNFEIHPKGHGWHIHSVWNCFIPLKQVLEKFHEFGFGRVDIRRVNSRGVSDYLTKHALKAYRGVSKSEIKKNPSFRLRLVNTSRGLPVLSDYAWKSELKDDVRALYNRHIKQNRVKCFPSLFTSLEVCALLRLKSLSELHSYIYSLSANEKSKTRKQGEFDFMSVVSDAHSCACFSPSDLV